MPRLMKQKELQKISDAIKDIPDDAEAWENACDLMTEISAIEPSVISNCKDRADYAQLIYRRAYNIEQVVHVMKTVPVYLLARNVGEDDQLIVTLFNEIQPLPFVPVFWKKERALKELEFIEIDKKSVSVIRVPFFLLVDDQFGISPDAQEVPLIILFDDREGVPGSCIDKYLIMDMMEDSAKTLRSDNSGGARPNIDPKMLQIQTEDHSEEKLPSRPIPSWRGKKKPPVS